MNFAPYPSSTGKSLEVIEVTEDTITVRSPKNGATKTIPRPADYDPEKGRVAVAAPAKATRKRLLEVVWSTNICDGMWTVKLYSDGTRTASLTDRWDPPLPRSTLRCEAQLAAQREYEASLGPKA